MPMIWQISISSTNLNLQIIMGPPQGRRTKKMPSVRSAKSRKIRAWLKFLMHHVHTYCVSVMAPNEQFHQFSRLYVNFKYYFQSKTTFFFTLRSSKQHVFRYFLPSGSFNFYPISFNPDREFPQTYTKRLDEKNIAPLRQFLLSTEKSMFPPTESHWVQGTLQRVCKAFMNMLQRKF